MLAILTAIPGIGAIVQGILGLIFDAKVKITQARVGADRDVAVGLVKATEVEAQARATAMQAIASNKILTLLVVAFATPLVIFEWKVIVVDIVCGCGTTDPIRGQVADWANTIIAFIFGAPTAITIGKMWFSRKTS